MSAVLANSIDRAGEEEIRSHIAWLGASCERCLVMATKYDGLHRPTADALRDIAGVHARTAQTWAEELAAGRGM